MISPQQRPLFAPSAPPQVVAWEDAEHPYRYALGRAWGDTAARVCWVMLNPSTADASHDDPTVRRCIALSRSWGYGALVVVNLFALRSTDPDGLKASGADPVGPRNDRAIVEHASLAELVVAAWGAHGGLRGRDREVLAVLGPLHHLGLTKAGHPRHPLYLPGDVTPTRWSLE